MGNPASCNFGGLGKVEGRCVCKKETRILLTGFGNPNPDARFSASRLGTTKAHYSDRKGRKHTKK